MEQVEAIHRSADTYSFIRPESALPGRPEPGPDA
jgi:hypothetical protein